ncbi:pyridoxal-phosphate dependent enzyme [Patescibacteria group bacterium]|nr:pyridoxal-phosphate dependent enzyme [Patescibacteria group bacterium]
MEIPKIETLEEYLSPTNFTGRLVLLSEELNPFAPLGVDIYVKILWENPVLNGKFFPAYWMLKQAYEQGRLKGVRTLYEATSGNMAKALKIFAPYFGIERVVAVVPPNIAEGKLEMLELVGAEVLKMENGIEKAKELGSAPGCLNLFQYGNNDNPGGYYHFLAPNLWAQAERDIAILSVGMGTTGTIQGLSRYLREQKARTLVLGNIVAPGENIPGVRTDAKLQEVQFDFGPLVDATEHVTRDEAMLASLRLVAAGVYGGPSTGFTYAGLLKHLGILAKEDRLDALRNGQKRIRAVFISFDTPDPYGRDYRSYSNKRAA